MRRGLELIADIDVFYPPLWVFRRSGLQHKIIQDGQPNGIPLNMTLLPEVLKTRYNYSTHMLGKWYDWLLFAAVLPAPKAASSNDG